MHYETIIPEHGIQEHIITEELDDGKVEVACGHDHFVKLELDVHRRAPSIVNSEGDKAETVCKNCIRMISQQDKTPKRYWYET